MEVRVTLENLRAGEKPLAMFLHDALRHIDEQYIENIVASYARNARASSQPSDSSSNSHRDKMLDERGRRRTSLEQFDLSFQLSLFEALLGTVRSGNSDDGIPQDIRTTFKSSLHLRGDTLHKVIALRKYRNDVVHHHLDRGDIAATIGELGKILDVFRGELLTCCKSQPDVFAEATVSSIQAYVDSIVKLLLDAQEAARASEPTILEGVEVEEVEDVEAEFVEESPSTSTDVAQRRVSGVTLNSAPKDRRKMVMGIAGALLAAVAVAVAVYVQQSTGNEDAVPTPTRAAVFIMNEPLTESASLKFRTEISNILLTSEEYWRITVIRYGMSDTSIVTQLDSGSIDQRLLDVMRASPALTRVTEVKNLFARLTSVLKNKAYVQLQPQAFMFGSLPNPTAELYAELAQRTKKDNNILHVQGLKNAFATMKQTELLLFRFGAPRYVDSAIARTINPDTTGFKLILTDL